MGVAVVRMNFGPGSTFEGSGVLDVWHSFKIYAGLIVQQSLLLNRPDRNQVRLGVK